VTSVILLDSGPLGLITNPKLSPLGIQCNQWLRTLLSQGTIVLVPAITDYEVRRELIRADRTKGLQRLDFLKDEIGYLPLTPEALLKAAELWAEVRQKGLPTADDKALDIDVVLAAQALTIDASDVAIATSNPKHLSRFVSAIDWTSIS
jgi:predicted nucleic acid-binding protein